MSSVVGMMSLKRAATMLAFAEFERYSFDCAINTSGNILFAPPIGLLRNLNRDRCNAYLCAWDSTCRDESGLSGRGAKTNNRLL